MVLAASTLAMRQCVRRGEANLEIFRTPTGAAVTWIKAMTDNGVMRPAVWRLAVERWRDECAQHTLRGVCLRARRVSPNALPVVTSVVDVLLIHEGAQANP
jgi:hypothetical protein